ncbi:glucose dehydrogenase [Longimycelium tulufanense]|uniref:Glucose dehydrogenase n=1 Tax=Longimycelium tulufanense TaxID=907463 RepID=A0A8J3C9Z2_9PSEU|nr:glucose dehydrogenase [Longimycelium tulufanense]
MGRFALLAGAVTVLLAGCAQFPDSRPAADWRERPSLTPQAGPEPRLPWESDDRSGSGRQDQATASIPPPDGCRDHDPAVIATCLSPISAVVSLPDGESAFAAERDGRVLRVTKGREPVEIARLTVDTAGGGGVTGLALSPSYAEDQLVYAYVTTAEDNRVVRFAPGDKAKPILTGIPRGGNGNRGALASDRQGALLVATGDAGNPGAAADPGSLAGKVLRIDATGKPAAGNPSADSPVLASGLHSPGGLCTTRDGKATWVTDQASDRDLLYKVRPGALGAGAWNWPDKPGVAGCAAWQDGVMIALERDAAVVNVALNPDGSVSGQPQRAEQDTYGQLSPLDLAPQGTHAFTGTINKTGGKTVSSDDRVLMLIRKPNGGGKD